MSQTRAEPVRLKFTQAMDMLSVSRSTLQKLVTRGVFRATYPNGTSGRGKRIYLLTEEVRIYAEGGPDALKRYQQQAAKTAKAKK